MNRMIASALQFLLFAAMIAGISGCGAPTPATVDKGPPPPPAPVVEPAPPAPPEKPKPDPLQTALKLAAS